MHQVELNSSLEEQAKHRITFQCDVNLFSISSSSSRHLQFIYVILGTHASMQIVLILLCNADFIQEL